MGRFSLVALLPSFVALAVGLPSLRLGGRRAGALPEHGKVAILFRGQSFRKWEPMKRFEKGGVPSCSKSMLELQVNASGTVATKIIEPLESRGNKVDIVVTDQDCKLTKHIVRAVGKERMLARNSLASTGQANNMRQALEAFKDAAGGIDGLSNYDLILILRHDISWKTDISNWTSDYSNLNLFARCEEQSPIPDCVFDTFFMMPGQLFPAFDAAIGEDKMCFRTDEDPIGCGHGCYQPLQKAMNGKIGFVTDWRPGGSVRASNDIADMLTGVNA